MNSNWKKIRFVELPFNSRSVDPKKKFGEGYFTYIDIKAVEPKTNKISQPKKIKGNSAPSRAKRLVKTDDVLISSVRPYLKSFALIDKNFDNSVASTGFFVLEKNEYVLPKYLLYFAFSDDFIKQTNKLTQGSSYPALNQDLFEKIEISLPYKNNKPDVEEQKRIVNKIEEFFAEIDKAVEKTKIVLENSQKLLRSEAERIFNDLSSRKTGKAIPYKIIDTASVFSDGDWIEKKDQSSNGILLIQTGNVGNGLYRDKKDRRYINEPTFKRLKCKEVFPGDILISRLPYPVGRACIVPELGIKMITAVDCTIFRPKRNFDKTYLKYFLNSKNSLSQVENFLSGSSRKRISRKNLEKIEIHIPVKNNKPDLQEQKKIAKRLDKIQEQTKKLEGLYKSQLKDLEKLKQSILEKAFAGELVKEEKQKLILSPFVVWQGVGVILDRGFERGEMVIAKTLYLAQEIYQIPLGINFTPQKFGPYDTEMKKIITAGLSPRNKFFIKKGYGESSVYALGSNSQKLFGKYQTSKVSRGMNKFLDEMLPYFNKSDSKSIERLATVCKIIQDTQNDDIENVWSEMQNWKKDRFIRAEVEKSLGFIKNKKWDRILIK